MIAACGQMEATTMDQAGQVWLVVDRLAVQAASVNADLLVLPEATYPAYHLESAERYRRADIERSAKVLERLGRLAARHSFWLVAGFVQEDADRLYNSAAVFDRRGRVVGVARKTFLWDCDHQWFTPGDKPSVFDTEFGGLGVVICADARVPEIPATLAAAGANLIVEPTAWVNTSEVRRTYRNIQPDFLIRARAIEFGIPLVCSSKAGREGTVLEYVGQSQIVTAGGEVVAKAPLGGEHLMHAEVSPATPKPAKIEAARLQRLLSPQPPYRPERPGGTCTVHLRRNAEAIGAELTAAGARVVQMSVTELDCFAPARCHALDGVQVLVVRGRIIDDVILRTRAAENRVFAIAATDSAQLVIEPDGSIAWRRADWQDTVDLDLGQADVKQFNPNTDLWAQRRVECYRL